MFLLLIFIAYMCFFPSYLVLIFFAYLFDMRFLDQESSIVFPFFFDYGLIHKVDLFGGPFILLIANREEMFPWTLWGSIIGIICPSWEKFRLSFNHSILEPFCYFFPWLIVPLRVISFNTVYFSIPYVKVKGNGWHVCRLHEFFPFMSPTISDLLLLYD